jgi:flavin reductase (DIM6/NTAB) family NADH-FMN oxidoreductase RutF
MNQTSAALPRGTDEFEFAGLTPIAGNIVKADRIAQSPVSFECKLSQCIQLTAANGDKIDTWLVLGEVVAVHIEKHLLSPEGIYQTALAEPVLRAGGPSAYYGISDELRFDLHRPTL